MTKTTAEVKRYLGGNGEFVLATDYAALQQRCRELEECVGGLCESIVMINISPSHYSDTCTCADCQVLRNVDATRTKALALLSEGGEKGVGT